jgi:RNA polymerase sigma factor (TIGR02999 family)
VRVQNYNGLALKKDPHGLEKLTEALYDDLHRIAGRHLRNERPNHTLQPTALLNEAYLKLSENRQRQFNDRTHFLAIASRVMRQVLVDYARARATRKRGRKRKEVESEEALAGLQLATDPKVEPILVLQLNRTFEALSREDAGLAKLVELRYFGGMTTQEIADTLGCSIHVVRYDLRLAEAWLRRNMGQTPAREA